jgi:hypothetical protein
MGHWLGRFQLLVLCPDCQCGLSSKLLCCFDLISPSSRDACKQRVDGLAESFSKYQQKKHAALPALARMPIKEYLAESRGLRAAKRPRWFEQFRLLIVRQWKQTSRDLYTNGLRMVSTLALAGLFGAIFWKLGLTVSNDMREPVPFL